MSIIREAKLKNILPSVKAKQIDNYFIYPSYLKGDKDIDNLKKYLSEVLSK